MNNGAAENVDSFENDCCDAAINFLQTMIVVDDQASLNAAPKEEVKKISKPSMRRKFTSESHDDSEPRNIKSIQRELDAKILTEQAMEQGLVCSVLRPVAGENISDKVIRAAEIADIVSLDWEMDDSGQKATDIIKKILAKDHEQNGRLRLIAVYTGQKTIEKVCNRVFKSIGITEKKRIGAEQLDKVIVGKFTRIVFLIKAHVSKVPDDLKQFVVSEAELPQRLVKEFSKLSNGILPNVAMASIAAVRKATHHILAKYHSGMDGPLLTHRALIPIQEEASAYSVDLIASELQSVLSMNQIGERFASLKSIKKKIDFEEKNGNKFKIYYPNDKRTCIKEKEFTAKDLLLMLEVGVESAFKQLTIQDITKNITKKYFTTILTKSVDAAKKYDMEFSRITTVRNDIRDRMYHRLETPPHLSLGTIVKDNKGKYLICVQPSCDCLRVKEPRPFPFIPMEIVDEKPEYVVWDNKDKKDVGLVVAYNPHKIQMITFDPSKDNSQLVKAESSKGLCFKSINNKKYDWVADFKRTFSQRISQELANNLARIGIDEFEVQRLNGNNN